MANTIINNKMIALFIVAIYVVFSIQTIRDIGYVNHGQISTLMFIVDAMAYIVCAYFFLELQRGRNNLLEKIAACASAGVFITRTVRLSCVAFRIDSSHLSFYSYGVAVFFVIATVALIGRMTQLFIEKAA